MESPARPILDDIDWFWFQNLPPKKNASIRILFSVEEVKDKVANEKNITMSNEIQVAGE